MTSPTNNWDGEPKFGLIVHNFTDSDRPSFSSDTAILDSARSIVKYSATKFGTKWKCLNPPHGSHNKDGNVYTLSTLPPRVRGSRVLDIKEWGTAVDDNEIYDIQELEEFRTYLMRHEPDASSSPRRPPSPSQAEERPRKRLKVEAGSLFSWIPQPHIRTSPNRPGNATVAILPFSKAKPIILPPHTFTDFKPLPQTRTAWIVPVRGTLPWEGSSSAVTHTSTDPSDLKPFDGTISGIVCTQIMWNKASLVEFWSFLLTLRDKGTLGPIGISFHTSHSSRSCTQTSAASSHKDKGYHQGHNGTTSTVDKDVSRNNERSSSSARSNYRSIIKDADYIKIYHDGAVAMRVRSVLDAWRYIGPSNDKVRVLLEAKLVLLDERARGLLIC
ncbi:hypothetical protein EYR40_000258 [Pleurotus pulmonarius]|nr:hypothetical protein EYR40_000258 [Pleurotus pulmonarius]